MAQYLLEKELEDLNDLKREFQSQDHSIEELGEASFVLNSKTDKIDLCLFSLVHGDEIGGLIAINKLLKEIVSGKINPMVSLGLVVANIPAARKSTRYIETDLNRCFGVTNGKTHEEQLAESLKKIAKRSRYLMDIHQTAYETASDFFIFPHTTLNTGWAASLCGKTPIIVHGLEFSKDGLPLDTFATQEGAIAITYEMGEIGSCPRQVEKTVALFEQAIESVEQMQLLKEPLRSKNLFHFTHCLESSSVRGLLPGFKNFDPVFKGQKLGFDHEEEILSPVSGYLLFPKYGDLANKSSELCQIVSRVTDGDNDRLLEIEREIVIEFFTSDL